MLRLAHWGMLEGTGWLYTDGRGSWFFFLNNIDFFSFKNNAVNLYALYRKFRKHSASILLDLFPLRFLYIGCLFSHYCNYPMGIIM